MIRRLVKINISVRCPPRVIIKYITGDSEEDIVRKAMDEGENRSFEYPYSDVGAEIIEKHRCSFCGHIRVHDIGALKCRDCVFMEEHSKQRESKEEA